MNAVIGSSLRVVERFAGDAALIFNGDLAYFLRRDGVLRINTQHDVWSPERIALIHGPFVREGLPDL
jgi:hypothetical protein